MADKNVKRCSTSLATKEIQIKTTRYHFAPTRMAKVQKTHNNKCWEACGEIRTLIHC